MMTPPTAGLSKIYFLKLSPTRRVMRTQEQNREHDEEGKNGENAKDGQDQGKGRKA
jgi:hypothetical protein